MFFLLNIRKEKFMSESAIRTVISAGNGINYIRFAPTKNILIGVEIYLRQTERLHLGIFLQ